MTPELYRACQKAVQVITGDGNILKAGRASLFVLLKLGYPRWFIYPLMVPPLIWLVELGYRIVAGHRAFFGRFLFRGE
jgi:cytochrome c oxidase subunit IV